MLKFAFYALAACLFLAPILAWAYLTALACAYNTGSTSCGVQLSSFVHPEFLVIVVIPWLLAAGCLYLGRKRR